MRPGLLIITFMMFTLSGFSRGDSKSSDGREWSMVAEQPEAYRGLKADGEREKTKDATKTTPEKGNPVPATRPSEQTEQSSPQPEAPSPELFYSYPDELKIIPEEFFDLALSFEYFG